MPVPLARAAALGTSGGARDREAYFVAGYDLLAEGGCEAVTVTALSQRLHATTGSFYHHFAHLPAFVQALAERWQQGMLVWLDDCAAVADPLRRHELIVNQSVEFLFTPGESAVRAWAHTDMTWAMAMFAVHHAADEMSVRTLEELVGDPELARLQQGFSLHTAVGLSLRAAGSLDANRYLQMTRELARRAIGVETELVDDGGTARFRFLDGHQPDCPPDLPWTPPNVTGLSWAHRDPRPSRPEPAAETNPRSREDYFAAGRELLATRSFDGLTIEALCDRLGVTKGSFRWHFGGMPAFVEALSADWEQQHRAQLDAAAEESGPVAQLEVLLLQLLEEPDPVDVAMRAWAHTEPVVGQALHRSDNSRRDLIGTALREATGDPAAGLMAEAMLGLAIGLQQPLPGVDPDTAARIVHVFARKYLRIDAELHATDNQPVLRIRRQG